MLYGVSCTRSSRSHCCSRAHSVCGQAECLHDELLPDLHALNRPAAVCCSFRHACPGHRTRGHLANVLTLERIKGSAPRAQHTDRGSILRGVCRDRALGPALLTDRATQRGLWRQQRQQYA